MPKIVKPNPAQFTFFQNNWEVLYDQLQEIERHLSFRDYLRQNPKVCKEYGDLKSELADKYPTNIESYGDDKDDFVKKVEKEALKWHWKIR